MSEENINYTKEAFFHPLNLGILFGATLTSFFLNDAGMIPNVILTMTFGLELMFLGTVPRLPNFRKMIKLRKLKEREPVLESKNIFNTLIESDKKRFLILKHLTIKIRENFEKQSYSSQGLLQNIEQKIDGLMNNYINLLDLNNRFRLFIQTASKSALKQEIDEENAELEQIESERLKERKRRRILILNKRLERFESAEERYQICTTELETIEDAIRYIFEQSMTMNNPEEIGFQLDNLLMEVEETSSIIEAMDGTGLDDFGIFKQKDDLDTSFENEEAPEASQRLKSGS
ncbi:hypothetical protein EP331_10920 [bacterium]|nr:MAG: hypothetical protein EP331_10920 [bacterium]